MDEFREVDPNATLLRVRQLVTTEDAAFMAGLSRAEVADMVLCMGGCLAALRSFLPGAIDALVGTPVEGRLGGR